jgi:hypothetical protein
MAARGSRRTASQYSGGEVLQVVHGFPNIGERSGIGLDHGFPLRIILWMVEMSRARMLKVSVTAERRPRWE